MKKKLLISFLLIFIFTMIGCFNKLPEEIKVSFVSMARNSKPLGNEYVRIFTYENKEKVCTELFFTEEGSSRSAIVKKSNNIQIDIHSREGYGFPDFNTREDIKIEMGGKDCTTAEVGTLVDTETNVADCVTLDISNVSGDIVVTLVGSEMIFIKPLICPSNYITKLFGKEMGYFSDYGVSSERINEIEAQFREEVKSKLYIKFGMDLSQYGVTKGGMPLVDFLKLYDFSPLGYENLKVGETFSFYIYEVIRDPIESDVYNDADSVSYRYTIYDLEGQIVRTNGWETMTEEFFNDGVIRGFKYSFTPTSFAGEYGAKIHVSLEYYPM